MTMTPEPKYWRVFDADRRELVDKTPESEIYVPLADYRKAVAQQERCAGMSANEWRALWVQQAKQDEAKGVEISMLRIAIQAMKDHANSHAIEEFHVLRILGNGQISAVKARELIDEIRAGKSPELLPFVGSTAQRQVK